MANSLRCTFPRLFYELCMGHQSSFLAGGRQAAIACRDAPDWRDRPDFDDHANGRDRYASYGKHSPCTLFRKPILSIFVALLVGHLGFTYTQADDRIFAGCPQVTVIERTLSVHQAPFLFGIHDLLDCGTISG